MVPYSYKDVPTVLRFSQSDAFIRGLMGPFGSGKSSGCCWELPYRGLRQAPGWDGIRHTRFVVIRNSFRQLEDSTERTFLQWFPPYVCGDWRATSHNYILKAFRAADNEPTADIEVCFRALDRPDQLGNLLSTEYTGAWLNEGRDIPWSIWEAVMGRVGRYPSMKDGGCTWSGVWGDTNPPDTESKWYKFFEEEDHREDIETLNRALLARDPKAKLFTKDTFSAIFKQPSGTSRAAENIRNLPPAYYERLAVGKSKDWVKVYIHGDYGFSVDGMAVFPEYSEEQHCPDDPKKWPRLNPELPILRSYDFGLTPSCVFGQETLDGRWIVTDELCADGMGFDEFSDYVLRYSDRNMRGCEFEDIGDPAGGERQQTDARTCFEIAAAKGILIKPAPQTLRIRLEGTRRALRGLVRGGRAQFGLHPRCKRLRKALLGGYHYRRVHVSGEKYENKPNKNEFSHVADAFTYQGAWLFGRALREPEGAGLAGHNQYAGFDDMSRSGVTGY
jgi:hypothetical protein